MTPAESTVKFAVFDALVSTILEHKAKPKALEKLCDTIVAELFSSPFRWAAKAYADELDSKDK